MPPPPAMTPHPQMGASDSFGSMPPPSEEDKNYAMLAHLGGIIGWVSSLVGIPIPFLGIVVPIVVYFMKKDSSPYVVFHCRQEFHWIVLTIGVGLLMVPLVLFTCGLGIVIALPVMVICVILNIVAAVKAKNGETYRYPVSGNWTFLDSVFK